jgi:hypothetical protein
MLTSEQLSIKLATIINDYMEIKDIEQFYIKLYNLNTVIHYHIEEKLYNDYLQKMTKIILLLSNNTKNDDKTNINFNINEKNNNDEDVYNCITIVNKIICVLNT